MYRREALSLIASAPLLSLLSSDTPELIQLNYPNRGTGSIRALSDGEVVQDKSISDRQIWRLYVDYYASVLGITVPDFKGFTLHKVLHHERKYRSLGYHREKYLLNIVLSKNKSVLYHIPDQENWFVLYASDSEGIIEATEYHLEEVDFE